MPTANTAADLRLLRVDQVGGLCAPSRLRDVFAQYKVGTAPQEELDRAKDEAIRYVIAKQESIGLRGVTDGEFRREFWHIDFLSGLDGVESFQAEHGIAGKHGRSPNEFWQRFFLVQLPVAAIVWGPVVGPLVGMLSFVCSIGNVPFAAVLWSGGRLETKERDRDDATIGGVAERPETRARTSRNRTRALHPSR